VDTAVLDLAGLEHLFGSPEKIARDIVGRARDLGLEAAVAVAANPDAAIHAARGFREITLIPAGQESEYLSGLPVDVLAPPREILETLDRWGVRTLKALAALPPVALSERLGQEGVHLQKLARGRTCRTLVPVEVAPKFEEVMELEYPVTLLESLAFILGRLLNQLCTRLKARSLATQELRLELEFEAGVEAEFEIRNLKFESRNSKLKTQPNVLESRISNPAPRTLRLPVPTQDAQLLLKLWLLNLNSDPPRAPIVKVALAAEPVKPRVAQGGLFLPSAPDPEKLEVTLARIAGVVGKEKVGSPELMDTHRPGAFRMGRFMGVHPAPVRSSLPVRSPGLGVRGKPNPSPGSQISNSKSQISNPEARPTQEVPRLGPLPVPGAFLEAHGQRPAPDALARMALRMFRPPLPATVEVLDGRPARVFAFGVRGDVVAAAGPWRTSGDWWRDNPWGQDEWDVELSSAPGSSQPVAGHQLSVVKPGPRTRLYRIYRDLATGNWFVQGNYD